MGLGRIIREYKRKRFYQSELPSDFQNKNHLVDSLLEEIRGLPKISVDKSHTKTWEGFRSKFREELLSDDPRRFTSFPSIRASMYCSPKALEYDAVKNHRLLSHLKPKTWGRPMPYGRSHIDENTVHQFYVLQRLLSEAKDLSRFANIIEFGGGYGNLSTIFRDLGFKGDYIIYDLPEFSALQKFYLKGNGYLSAFPNTYFLQDPEKVRTSVSNFDPDKTLFVAHWSLSESPLEVRENILSKLKSKNYFICYQADFDGLDNKQYFSKLKMANPDMRWIEAPFDHLKNSYSLVGLKN